MPDVATMIVNVGSWMIPLRFLCGEVIEEQNRGVRWQTEVVCQKRIRGLLRAMKRFFFEQTSGSFR